MSADQGGTTYLSRNPDDFFPDTLMGSDDSQKPPDWFTKAVKRLLNTKTKVRTKSPIIFEVSKEAANRNAQIFESYGFDLGKLLGLYSRTRVRV